VLGLLAVASARIFGDTALCSNLQANTDNGQININAQNLNILSSQDTSNIEFIDFYL
jgi:hypothetical protein